MRALLLSNLFPTSADPNRGLFTAQLAREMSTLCDLRVMVPLPWTPQGPFMAKVLPARYRQFALARGRMDFGNCSAFYPRYPMLPRVSERWHAALMQAGLQRPVARLRRIFPFDVINAHWLYPDGVAAAAIARALDVPLVLTGLGCDVNEFLFQDDKRRQILEALRTAASITVVSRELADVLAAEGFGSDRVTTIPNGVDTTRFRPADRQDACARLAVDPQRRLVVCVSRLSPEKGVRVLVEASGLLARQRPDALVVVIGDGDERGALQSRIEELGTGGTIRLAGAVPHEQVATWLAAANVVCMPSLREGHPNAAMESLASGRPLVASRVGALGSMISDGNGILVPPGDPGALAGALAEALDQHWNAASISGSVADCSWVAAARHYVDILKACVNRRRLAA